MTFANDDFTEEFLREIVLGCARNSIKQKGLQHIVTEDDVVQRADVYNLLQEVADELVVNIAASKMPLRL